MLRLVVFFINTHTSLPVQDRNQFVGLFKKILLNKGREGAEMVLSSSPNAEVNILFVVYPNPIIWQLITVESKPWEIPLWCWCTRAASTPGWCCLERSLWLRIWVSVRLDQVGLPVGQLPLQGILTSMISLACTCQYELGLFVFCPLLSLSSLTGWSSTESSLTLSSVSRFVSAIEVFSLFYHHCHADFGWPRELNPNMDLLKEAAAFLPFM